jgi:hypothetical protein
MKKGREGLKTEGAQEFDPQANLRLTKASNVAAEELKKEKKKKGGCCS